MLVLKDVSVSVDSLPIITHISYLFKPSTTVIIQGDNGSGKSTLVSAIMGRSGYTLSGTLVLHGQDISLWPVEQRAQAGIFLSYQYPIEVPGLSIKSFLQHAYRSCHAAALSLNELDAAIEDAFHRVGLPLEYAVKNLHEGFSGGQKKRLELIQMLVLKPRIIMFDEIDSGLDAQGLQMLVSCIAWYKKLIPESIYIIITHNKHIVEQLQPDDILSMKKGTLRGA